MIVLSRKSFSCPASPGKHAVMASQEKSYPVSYYSVTDTVRRTVMMMIIQAVDDGGQNYNFQKVCNTYIKTNNQPVSQIFSIILYLITGSH